MQISTDLSKTQIYVDSGTSIDYIIKHSKYQITKEDKINLITLPTRGEHTQRRPGLASETSRVAGPDP